VIIWVPMTQGRFQFEGTTGIASCFKGGHLEAVFAVDFREPGQCCKIAFIKPEYNCPKQNKELVLCSRSMEGAAGSYIA